MRDPVISFNIATFDENLNFTFSPTQRPKLDGKMLSKAFTDNSYISSFWYGAGGYEEDNKIHIPYKLTEMRVSKNSHIPGVNNTALLVIDSQSYNVSTKFVSSEDSNNFFSVIAHKSSKYALFQTLREKLFFGSIATDTWKVDELVTNNLLNITLQGDISHFYVDDNNVHFVWCENKQDDLFKGCSVFYRSKDTKSNQWSKPQNLSGNMKCLFPTVTASGKDVVVAWTGLESPEYGVGSLGDIYYIISHDYGRTWNSPYRITNHKTADAQMNQAPKIFIKSNKLHFIFNQGKNENVQMGKNVRQFKQTTWSVIYQAKDL